MASIWKRIFFLGTPTAEGLLVMASDLKKKSAEQEVQWSDRFRQLCEDISKLEADLQRIDNQEFNLVLRLRQDIDTLGARERLIAEKERLENLFEKKVIEEEKKTMLRKYYELISIYFSESLSKINPKTNNIEARKQELEEVFRSKKFKDEKKVEDKNRKPTIFSQIEKIEAQLNKPFPDLESDKKEMKALIIELCQKIKVIQQNFALRDLVYISPKNSQIFNNQIVTEIDGIIKSSIESFHEHKMPEQIRHINSNIDRALKLIKNAQPAIADGEFIDTHKALQSAKQSLNLGQSQLSSLSKEYNNETIKKSLIDFDEMSKMLNKIVENI
ncbi:MAG: hypothetical protein WC471_01790 [Candidatus Woesearchaeota archaeon]